MFIIIVDPIGNKRVLKKKHCIEDIENIFETAGTEAIRSVIQT